MSETKKKKKDDLEVPEESQGKRFQDAIDDMFGLEPEPEKKKDKNA